MKMKAMVLALSAWLLAVAAHADERACMQSDLRLNQVQLIGTHNSYHIEPDPAIFGLMLRTHYAQSERWPASRLAPALQYTFPPLDVQLAYGVRHLEIDVFYDPQGGRFADPGVYRALERRGLAPLDPFTAGEALRAPGFKVMHAADLDVRSSCVTFTACLETVRAWSMRNPGHAPIVIQIEAKEGVSPAVDGAYEPAQVLPLDADAFRALDAEIRSVFPRTEILTPDEVRGDSISLNAAVREHGWPRLGDIAGRVMFTLGDTPATQRYLHAYPGARGGLLFPSVSPNDPDTAWLNLYDPADREIARRVREGFLVYTRADAQTQPARRNDPRTRDLAFASGAQIVSTDYPWPDMRLSPYRVVFPDGGFVRANPILAQQGCIASQAR